MSEETIDLIRAWHRRRVFAMEQRKRANLALASFLRMALGWRKDLPDAERKAINDHALVLIKDGEKAARANAKNEPAPDFADEAYYEWGDVILASIKSRAPFDAVEKQAEKEMGKLAQTLPVWDAFAKDIRGFGAVSLAIIVAEAGDLANYPAKGHLWKRMGLAVLDGVRQGGLSKTASKDDWIAHGYNRQRRSRMWNIGDSLIKGNGDGFYRQYYLERKEIERAKAEAKGLKVVPAAKIPKGGADGYMSDGHVHRRAQRKMEIRLLTDLWRAWRRDTAEVPERAKACVPSVESLIEPLNAA